jgi:hypothetical protein
MATHGLSTAAIYAEMARPVTQHHAPGVRAGAAPEGDDIYDVWRKAQRAIGRKAMRAAGHGLS